jgi:hypothetical protein
VNYTGDTAAAIGLLLIDAERSGSAGTHRRCLTSGKQAWLYVHSRAGVEIRERQDA